MKTRADIYGKEAAELLRIITLYPGLCKEQLLRFFPKKDEKIENLLTYLNRQGRIALAECGGYMPYELRSHSPDMGISKAVWVLLDFIDRTEFHSIGEFPVSVLFFSDGELYEIIYVSAGREALTAQALRLMREPAGKRIVLVDSPGQISQIRFPAISAFCTVNDNGQVNYYQKQTEVQD